MTLLMFESTGGFSNAHNSNYPSSQGVSMMGNSFGGTAGTGNWDLWTSGGPNTSSLGSRMNQSSANGGWRWNLGTANTNTCFTGARLNFNTFGTGTRDFFQIWDSAGAVQCGMSLNSSSKLIFWRGTNATILGTGTTTLIGGVEYYIEVGIPLGNSVTIEVRINGVTEISAAAVDTTNTANQNWQYFWWSCAGPQTCLYTDFYCCDSAGSAPHNTFLGVCRIETLAVTTNNSVTWTPLSSTNASQVDDTGTLGTSTIDSDTTYNKTSTISNVDTFNHAALTSNPTTIFGVKVQTIVRKEDVGNRTYRNKMISGGTTSNGTTVQTYTGYMTQDDYYTTDPNTSAAWTATNVNSSKIGYELVS